MASIVSAGTTSATALNMSADTSGVLQLASNNGTVGLTMSTSQNIGIGTASPASDARLTIASPNTESYVMFSRTNSGVFDTAIGNNGGSLVFRGGADSSTVAGLTEFARIDSTGNFGLGVTPPATASTNYKGFWLQNGCNINSFGGNSTPAMYLQTNGFFNGTNTVYSVSSFGYTNYGMANGSFQWYTAPAGTAGGTVTSTEVMTLNNSGRLGIGNTSPAVKLDVIGGSLYDGNFYLNSQFRNQAAASEKGILLGYNNADTSSIIASAYASGAGALAFWTHNNSTWGERARIDSGGNLLVGVSGSIASGSNTTSGTQIAKTFLWVANEDASYFQRLNSDGTVQRFYRGANFIGSISVTTTGTVYNTTSDYRLKNITGALTGYKERLMSLQPKQGTWIANGSEFRGFLAHEFANPYRASVTGEKDAVDEAGNPVMQGMQASSSEVMADLVALVQEQQAIIDQLKADVTALKGAA